jgi:predicted Zn finger-like uncharacterized protein
VQAQCPHCAQRIVIDDAKVPDKPFAVKCPKCQTIVRLSGKATAAAPIEPELSFEEPRVPDPPAPTAVAPSAPAVAPTPLAVAPSAPTGEAASSVLHEEMRAQVMAQLRREMAGPGAEPSSHERALVSIPDRAQAAAITLILTRLGYSVDSVEEHEDAARFVEQGAYAIAATSRSSSQPGRSESLYQRITRLSPDQRRRLVVILVGDEFKSGDSIQAFAVVADLVLNSRDAGGADNLVRSVLAERKRLYQVFVDARRRFEASAA